MPVSMPFGQLSRYGVVGAVGTAVHYALMAGLLWTLTEDAVLASTAGAVAGAVVNYVLNYVYTFRSDKPHLEAIVKFWIVAAIGWGLNGAVLMLATDGLGLPVVPGQLAATGVVFFLTFGLNRIWTLA